ncbi:hypothetical protein Hanom_Chr01g00047761 [Helianthus anomalus]
MGQIKWKPSKIYLNFFQPYILLFKIELIARMVPVVSRFFTFSPHLLKIAGMLPIVCHFVTRIVHE